MSSTNEMTGNLVIAVSGHGEKYIGYVKDEDLAGDGTLENRICETVKEKGFICLYESRIVFERVGLMGQEHALGVVRNVLLLTSDISTKPEDGIHVQPTAFRVIKGESLNTSRGLMKEAEQNEMQSRAQRSGIEIPTLNTHPRGQNIR